MEKENARAEEHGYPTPICASKADTDANFDAALRYILDYLDTISLFAGTHNEESSLLLIDLMKEKNIDATDLRVWFGQLYGMSDHIKAIIFPNEDTMWLSIYRLDYGGKM